MQREASSSKRLGDEESGLPEESGDLDEDAPEREPSDEIDHELRQQSHTSRAHSFGDHNAAQAFTTAVRSVV